MLFRRGVIEKWGRGTLKIIEETERAGLARPEFEDVRGQVTVRFFPPAWLSGDLSDLQRELLRLLAREGPSSLGTIGALVGSETPLRTIQDNLRSLRESGRAIFQGRGAGARWQIAAGTSQNSPPERS